MGAEMTDNFTYSCECGETVKVESGRPLTHACAPITAQMVRDAWAEGYAFAHSQIASGA